jgi:hypothetical protein
MADVSHIAVGAISVIASLGVALSACEDLTMRSVYSDDGLLSWSVLRVTRRQSWGRRLRLPLDHLFGSRGFTTLLVAKLISALGLVAAVLTLPDNRLAAAVLTLTTLSLFLLTKSRASYGLDGADHMYLVVFLGLAIFQVMPSGSIASLAGILYIAAQSSISYLIAGIAKIRGPSWRDGSAISGILTTKIYGNATAAALLQGRSALGRLMCWSVIAFEVTFVTSIVADPRMMWTILMVGLLFHAINTVLMGLNSFFFAFVSTYPAIVVANELVHRALP